MLLLTIPPTASAASCGDSSLRDYVARPDASYQWQRRAEGSFKDGSFVELSLVSQTWRDIVWKHQLYIIKPTSLDSQSRHAVLVISGGSWRDEMEAAPNGAEPPKDARYYRQLANRTGSLVAILRQVPHQPLFGGMREDEIIAFTFDRYLESKDEDWPLLLPMVKSAVRAMDTIDNFAKSEWNLAIDGYTVTGASKRGWTTWLTATVDDRVKAIAPMVIDMLNMSRQIEHQRAVWSELSYKISDYTDRDLDTKLTSPDGECLRNIVDPYSYRQALALPKLIIIGTNDRYWPLDALNLYWKDLTNPKYALYVPNNRHGLKDYNRVISSLNALHRHAALGENLPPLAWQFDERDGKLLLTMASKTTPQKLLAWVATSPTRDFRESKWKSHTFSRRNDEASFAFKLPGTGYLAMFGEAVFD